MLARGQVSLFYDYRQPCGANLDRPILPDLATWRIC